MAFLQKIKIKIIFCLFLIIVLINTPLFSKTRIITLQECIQIALQNNPDIFVSAEDKNLASAKYKLARASRNIKLGAEILTRQYDADFGGNNTSLGMRFGLSASYNLLDEKNRKKQKVARVSIDIAKINEQKIYNKIILNVKVAYYKFLMSAENRKMRYEINNRHQWKLSIAKKLFKSGQKPILDVTNAEVNFAQSALQYEKAKNLERAARIQLYTSIGIKDKGIEIIARDTIKLPIIKYNLEQLYKLSKLYYPAVNIIKLEKKINKLKIAVEKASRYPIITFNLLFGIENRYMYYNNTFEGTAVSENWVPKVAPHIKIHIPLYEGGAISASVDSAIINYNKSVYKEREIILILENQIRHNYEDLSELLKQIEMAELIIKNAKKNLLLASKSYKNGHGSQLALQDAQTSVIKAELGFITAKYDYLITIAKLENFIGLREEYICK